MNASAKPVYVLGHSERELQRLALQAQYWGETTLEFAPAGWSRLLACAFSTWAAAQATVAFLAASLVGLRFCRWHRPLPRGC